MAAEIHDERTAHDTHHSIYERIEALESRFNA